MAEDLEEARERHFWRVVLRVTWSGLVVAIVAGVLAAITVALGWSGRLLLGSAGLVAGACVAVGAAGSGVGREVTAGLVGGLTLPLIAAHLASVAARSEAELGEELAHLVPFAAYAAGALLAGVAVTWIWRGRAARAPAEREPGVEEGRAAAAREGAARAAQEVSP